MGSQSGPPCPWDSSTCAAAAAAAAAEYGKLDVLQWVRSQDLPALGIQVLVLLLLLLLLSNVLLVLGMANYMCCRGFMVRKERTRAAVCHTLELYPKNRMI